MLPIPPHELNIYFVQKFGLVVKAAQQSSQARGACAETLR